jgi:voltage-dependent potassium channel beta subunit
MPYRYLGNSGIRVSVLGWGNWINHSDEEKMATETIKFAYENGINFFDTAEIYGYGKAETCIGNALEKLKLPRDDIVISTKIFKSGTGLNQTFLSRKHIIEGVQNSLKRLKLDYVDVVFCHRYDNYTPIEEVCRAMNWVIEKGWAFYWGTSEWKASEIMEAHVTCEKLGLIKPIVEQPQYNWFNRDKFEKEYAPLFSKYKMGTTIWSPLMSGILTGKYLDGIPKGSRGDVSMDQAIYHFNYYNANKKDIDEKLIKLNEIAKKLNTSLAILALAWCIKNPDVSTCLIGCTKVEQLHENIKAIDVMELITPELDKEINSILGNNPQPDMDWRDFKQVRGRRDELLSSNTK